MNNWNEKFEYSLESQQKFDISMLYQHIPGCVDVRKTSTEDDRKGIDYIATLSNGAEILIDAKTRMPGSKKFWRHGEPDLALEVWSVVEHKKIGWTLSESTNVDYILYTFDPNEWAKYYFLPFQLLRTAFLKNGPRWRQMYKMKTQKSDYWSSACIFVPVSEVVRAVSEAMTGDVESIA